MNQFKLILLLMLIAISCSVEREQTEVVEDIEDVDDSCIGPDFEYTPEMGCDGQVYPNPKDSPYALPFPKGTKITMGLSNCSSSFHSSGQPDQYAFDFNFPEGTPFYASRAGKVVKVEKSKSSQGSSNDAGNYVVIDHGDDTYGLYYHSPKDGIYVEENTNVFQGEQLGIIGSSGLAGYPHLHFIVTKFGYSYPYEATPISFNNVKPPHVALHSFVNYEVCK